MFNVLVPINRLDQSFVKEDVGFVSQIFFDGGDGGKGMFDVSGFGVCVFRFYFFAQDFVYLLYQIVEGDLSVAGAIDGYAGDAGFGCGQDVAVDDIGYVGKVSALFAIAVDGRFPVVEDGGDEFGDHGRVL